jgi:hypothetical protein
MSLAPLTLGFIGCGLLILLCVLGVRIAYAAAIVGAFGLAVLTGWGPASPPPASCRMPRS